MFKYSRFVVASLAAVVSAMPAQAALTTFASFTGINSDVGMRFKNNGTSSSNGTGGSLYTIATPASTVPGSRPVNFSFLQAALSPFVSNVTATFSLFSTTSSPALTASGFKIQPNLTGGFSFLSTTVLTVGSRSYAAGSNLLSGTFNDVTIAGQNNASSAGFGGSTSGGATILYTSDFLTFAPGSAYDLSVSLTSLSPLLTSATGRALRTFNAYSTGSFSSEPAPVVSAVPEPAMWGVMVVGFGLVGIQARRRNRSAVAA